MALSGVLCLGGLLGMVFGNMSIRNVGIVGYAVVLPVIILLMGRLFAATPAVDDGSISQ
jgi:ATP/ADP translocase